LIVSKKLRILFSGSFQAGQCGRARDVVCQHLADGARDILYLVPNGAAARAVIQDLLRRRGAAFGVRVVTFGGLPREIERRARAVSPPALDALSTELLAEQATRDACRSIFPPGVPIRGLAAQVSRAVERLERDGAASPALADEVARIGGGSEGTEVLLRAWENLERLRPQFGRTAAEALSNAVALLKHDRSPLAGCDLVVLENLSLDHVLERELVETLIARATGDVVAAFESADHLSATPAARRLAVLRSLTRWDERLCARGAAPFDRTLRRVFTGTQFAERADAWRPGDGLCVRLLEAAGDVGEVRLAARVVQRHLREGVDPADVLVLFRSPGRYPQLVDEVFGSLGIPVSLPRPRAVTGTGLGDVLVRLLEAALRPERCTREASLALLRAPHVDIGDAAGDRLEWELVNGGFLGFTSWQGLDARRVGERTLGRVERFRRVLQEAHEGFRTLERAEDAARLARQLARDLRLIGNAYFARMRTLRRAGDDPALRALAEQGIREDNQAWEEIEEVLDRMPELLRVSGESQGVRGLSLAERWFSLLVRALRSARVPAPFPGSGAVRVSGTGAVSTGPARVVVVLGLLEKMFPRQARQDPFLRDDLRRALRECRGWHLPITDELAEAEREHFLRAISSATEVLYLSHPATDAEGRPALRSFFVEDLQRVLPYHCKTERARVSDLVPALADAGTAAEVLASVAHDAWQHLPSSPSFRKRRSLAFAVHDVLLKREVETAPLAGIRRPERHPSFDVVLFADAPHRTLRLSASQLRSIGHCTYQHFVDKVLRPEALQHPSYDTLRKGSLIHDAIMEWATELRGWERGDAALDELDAWVGQRIGAWPPAMAQDGTARHNARRNRERLREFLNAELEMVRGAPPFAATPRYSELAFGEQAEHSGRRDPASAESAFPMTVETADGTVTAHFRGSIDRVDIFERDGRRYGVAVDYKTGNSAKFYAQQMLEGNDLQLRLYLLALKEFWDVTPVGALYIGFGDGVRHGAVCDGFADHIPGIGKKEVARMSDADWERFAFDRTPARIAPLVGRIARLDISATPRGGDCGFCSFKPLCRFDATAGEVVHG
jgi:ATP-dependent helicase/DNAse subunit B